MHLKEDINMEIKGAQMFVKALQEEGVDTLFAYPGGTAIDLFDALYDAEGINMVLPRHEQALVHAADGYARSTGKVGVCLVTSGPGATNLVTGIATANFDSVPMVCFTGQVPTGLIGNDAFQEVDIVGITRSICKYAVTVRKREDLARVIKNAFYIARTGKPGPVVVDIPKDVQTALGSDEYPAEVNIRGYKPNEGAHSGQIKKALSELSQAKKPVFLIGGGVNIAHARDEMLQLAELTGVPVVTTIMGKGAIPTTHPLYVGNIGMHGNAASNKAIMECDVLFSIGTRFNDRITGTIDTFARNAKIIHIDIDAASISRNIKVDIPIVADAKIALTKMLKYAKPLDIKEWVDDIMSLKEDKPIHMSDKYQGVTPEFVIKTINEMYDNLILTTDVGQNQLWTTQYMEVTANKQLVTSGGLGTMGYGLPAAIGAKIGNPDKDVICISGDGGVQMNIQEMATAVTRELPVTLCIFNNSYLGNVRQWQELFFNKRYSSTYLGYTRSKERQEALGTEPPKYVPDFVSLAESYDAVGIRVTEKSEVKAAFEKAKANKYGPTIIEFIIDETANVYPMVPGGKSLDDMIFG